MVPDPTAFFSWTSGGEFDTSLAVLTKLIPKVENTVYHSYVDRQIPTAVYKEFASAVPEVILKLSRVLAILNNEVAHYPNHTPHEIPRRQLHYARSLAQTKAECAAIARLSGNTSNKQAMQQASLACIASAAQTAKLNGQEFLGLGPLKLPDFPKITASSIPAAAVLLAIARDFLN